MLQLNLETCFVIATFDLNITADMNMFDIFPCPHFKKDWGEGQIDFFHFDI